MAGGWWLWPAGDNCTRGMASSTRFPFRCCSNGIRKWGSKGMESDHGCCCNKGTNTNTANALHQISHQNHSTINIITLPWSNGITQSNDYYHWFDSNHPSAGPFTAQKQWWFYISKYVKPVVLELEIACVASKAWFTSFRIKIIASLFAIIDIFVINKILIELIKLTDKPWGEMTLLRQQWSSLDGNGGHHDLLEPRWDDSNSRLIRVNFLRWIKLKSTTGKPSPTAWMRTATLRAGFICELERLLKENLTRCRTSPNWCRNQLDRNHAVRFRMVAGVSRVGVWTWLVGTVKGDSSIRH